MSVLVINPYRFAAALPAAPTVVDSDSVGITPGVDPVVFPTSGLSWSAGLYSIFVISMDTSATISAVAGDTDDTSSLLDSHNNGSTKLFNYAMIVNGGAIDANWGVDLSASARAALAGVLFSSDVVGATAHAKANGTGGPYTAPAISVTGGPRNVLAVYLISVQGSHVTNPPVAPSGATLVLTRAATTNNPTLDDRSTLAIAYRSVAHSDLTWTGDAATIAATAWTGLSDAGSEPWASMSFGVLS